MKIKQWDLHDLDLADRVYARRAYRILRIAIYAPQDSSHGCNGMYQGCYGFDRDEAKEIIRQFFGEISWKLYLGSK